MKFRFRETLIQSTGRARQVSPLRRIARKDEQSCSARSGRHCRGVVTAVFVVLMILQSGGRALGQDQGADKKAAAVPTEPKSKKASPKQDESKGAPAAEKKEEEKKPGMNADTFSGLKFRSLGPAVASGRVVAIAVNPKNKFEFYVGVASGGVWKTVNDGTSWTSVFDKEGS